MAQSFDPTTIPSDVYRDQISQLTERLSVLDEKLAELESLQKERGQVAKQLDWWRQGLELFGAGSIKPQERVTAPSVNGSDPNRPSLRQAIKTVMREEQGDHWRIADMLSALTRRNWEPQGKNPEGAIAAMIADMKKKREIFWVARGVYALSPPDQLVSDEGDDDG